MNVLSGKTEEEPEKKADDEEAALADSEKDPEKGEDDEEFAYIA